jgi:hypothetical protein
MAAKKKAMPKPATAKKKASQPVRPDFLKNGGRFSEGYGSYTQVGNPGAGTFIRPMASDYIRPPMGMKSNKKKK